MGKLMGKINGGLKDPILERRKINVRGKLWGFWVRVVPVNGQLKIYPRWIPLGEKPRCSRGD